MKNINKQNATIAIWVSTMIISIFVIINAMFLESWVLAIPMGVAFLTTAVIWTTDTPEKTSGTAQSRYGETGDSRKESLPYTMALLMEMMDDDEREEFKYELKRRVLSGETLTNESLVEELEKRKRG